MKKLLMYIICFCILSFSFTGCKSSNNEKVAENEVIADNTDQTDNDENIEGTDGVKNVDDITKESNANTEEHKMYKSGRLSRTIDDGREPGEIEDAELAKDTFEEEYIFEVTGEKTGLYSDIYYYPDGLTSTSTYNGNYELREDHIRFTYGNDGDVFKIYLNNEKITEVEYLYNEEDTAELIGTFEGYSEVYGNMLLEASDNNKATISCQEGVVLDGTIYNNDGNWEFICSDGDDFIDWYLYVSGSKFTYETYREATFGKYAGEYPMFGDLGDVTMSVSREGYASIDIIVYGEWMHFEGSIYYDEMEEKITGVYLSSDDGHYLDLQLERLYDGTLNYSGSLGVPLGAG